MSVINCHNMSVAISDSFWFNLCCETTNVWTDFAKISAKKLHRISCRLQEGSQALHLHQMLGLSCVHCVHRCPLCPSVVKNSTNSGSVSGSGSKSESLATWPTLPSHGNSFPLLRHASASLLFYGNKIRPAHPASLRVEPVTNLWHCRSPFPVVWHPAAIVSDSQCNRWRISVPTITEQYTTYATYIQHVHVCIIHIYIYDMLDVLSDNGPASLLETMQMVCRIGATQTWEFRCLTLVRSSQNFISHERKKMKEVRRRWLDWWLILIDWLEWYLVGGFNPSEKSYSSQLGWLFPIYGKIKNAPPTRYWLD